MVYKLETGILAKPWNGTGIDYVTGVMGSRLFPAGPAPGPVSSINPIGIWQTFGQSLHIYLIVDAINVGAKDLEGAVKI